MADINYFKKKAKLFLKDFKTQYFDEEEDVYQYAPKYFADIDELIISYDINEENFSLMNAQHIIALLAGFRKWDELLTASEARLELGKLFIENRNESLCIADDFGIYLHDNGLEDLGDENILELFRVVFL